MNDVAVIAPVRKTVRVKAPIAHAFDVFTRGLTRWWPHDHGVGKQPIEVDSGQRGGDSVHCSLSPPTASGNCRRW